MEFGLKYLINRIGGGYIFGKLILKSVEETKMPGLSLSGYQEIFGEKSVPEMLVYDRGGHSKDNIRKLKKAGVKKVGIRPKGRPMGGIRGRPGGSQSERGMMEGVIGTLKTKKYGFNKPKERSIETLRRQGEVYPFLESEQTNERFNKTGMY